MAAKTLTPVQQKSSLSAKQNKLKLKTALLSPYISSWEPVSSEDTQKILECIARKRKLTFLTQAEDEIMKVCFELPSPLSHMNNMIIQRPDQKPVAIDDELCFSGHNLKNQSMSLMGESQKRLTKQQKEDLHSKPQPNTLRQQLVLGTSSVTRSMEQGHLRLVLVERSSPWKLHKHLSQLCAVRGCVAGAMEGLEATVGPHLGMTRLSAVGFKRIIGDDETFTPIVTIATELLPKLQLPWQPKAPPTTEIPDVSETIADPKITSFAMDTSHQSPGENNDYSHLYIMKADMPRQKRIRVNEGGDFISLDGGSQSFTAVTVKETEFISKPPSTYERAVIGRVKPNPEKLGKKKKKKKSK